MSRIARSFVRALTAVAIGVSMLTATLPATSTAPVPVFLDAEPPRSETIVYGGFTNVLFRSEQDLRLWQPSTYTVDGIPGLENQWRLFPYAGQGFREFFVSATSESQRIDVGRYNLSLTFSGTYAGTPFVGSTRIPYELIVEPAALATDLRVAPDRADPQNLVIAMRLTGQWLNEEGSTFRFGDSLAESDRFAAPPAGEWALIIRDADGQPLVDERVAQARGTEPAASFLWTDAPVSTPVTIEATFTPAADEAGNFTIAPTPAVEVTTGELSRPPVLAPEVPDDDTIETAGAGGVQVPGWALLIAALVGVASGVTALTLALRQRRSGAPAAEEDEATPETNQTNAEATENSDAVEAEREEGTRA